MDDENTKNYKAAELIEETEDQSEEALSLRGLILNSDEIEFQDRRRSSSSDPSELFEFFIDLNSEMSHAEDIIFCGKLMPFQENPPRLSKTQSFHKHHHHHHQNPTRNEKQLSYQRKRSESLNDLKTGRSGSSKNLQHQFMRNSRSLDYQKLYGNKYNPSSGAGRVEKEEIEKNPSIKSSGKCFIDAIGLKEKVAKPRWYMMFFGLVKFPQEMAYQDIKSRQVRRNPGTLFTSLDGGEKAIVSRPGDRRWSSSTWDLLRALSCKDHASVAVTTPFGCLQHV